MAESGTPGMGRGWLVTAATGTRWLRALATVTNGTSRVLSFNLTTSSPIETLAVAGAQGTAVDGTAARLKSLGLPAVSTSGETALLRATPSAGAAGIFALDGTSADSMARAGQHAPGSGRATWKSFTNAVLSPDGTSLAFAAKLAGGATSANDVALYHGSPGWPIVKLAGEGERADGAPTGAAWTSFSALAIPRGGLRAFFVAKLATGFGGVTASTGTGLWAAEEGGAFHLLVGEGVTQIGGATVRSFSALGAATGTAGSSRSFNAEHTIVVRALCRDGIGRIFTVRIPDLHQ